MPTFDRFPPASFNGTKFPVADVELKGGLRDHVHEYPHSPGGTPEKEGRKLYEITFTVIAQDTLAKYPRFYSDVLPAFRGVFESQLTADLVVPNVGTIQAYCVDWTQKASGKSRSGESVVWHFREDMPPDDLDAFIMSVSTSANLAGGVTNLGSAVDAAKTKNGLTQFLNKLGDLIAKANDVLSYKDAGDLYGNVLEAKLLGVADLCRQIDRLPQAADPTNWRCVYAMADILKAARDAITDLDSKKQKLQVFSTPALMSISDVAKALYGDASRGMDILRLNAIEDAFAIPRGTSVRYYPAA